MRHERRVFLKKNEKGQAIVLVTLALSLFLLGGLGLMIDVSHMFAQRQMAQVAADAAAQAGISSLFEAVNETTNTTAGACTSADARSSCVYARNNGFNLTHDTVTISFPSSVAGVTPSPDYPTPCVQAVVTRPVQTTFIGMLGASASTVLASGVACIVQTPSRTPILVLDKTDPNTFSINGTKAGIVVCGGPSQSIQIDSTNSSSISISGNPKVDLSQGGAGTNSGTGNCAGISNVGTGGIFGVNRSAGSIPSFLSPIGATEAYNDVGYIGDPLADVPTPSRPTTAGTISSKITAGTLGTDCPVSAGNKGCTVYTPGYYTTGISVKGTTAIFNPGIYYMDGSSGFSNDSLGDIMMCSAHCTADTSGCCSSSGSPANGMLVYVNGGQVSLASSNSAATMVGSSGACTLADANCFLGMLFFVNRTLADQSPGLGGGGTTTLTGTIYMPSQNLGLGGGSAGQTTVTGEIIVNQLSLGGNSTINMNLVSNYTSTVDQIALVQ